MDDKRLARELRAIVGDSFVLTDSAELRAYECDGNMSRTAEALGVERSNLYRKMKAYGLLPARREEA